MSRIYHSYMFWEDYKCGFYNNHSGKEKQNMIIKGIEMFNSERKTKKYMNKDVEEWKYSCEHNFTNPSLNKIAYIGQGACCLYGGIPNTITMEVWNMLDTEVQKRSNKIAEQMLNRWKEKNKEIQICLNLD